MSDIKLEESLEELIELLEEFKMDNWSQYFSLALEAYKSNPTLGAKKALSAYGGMGSFNDCNLPYHESVTPKGFSITEKRIQFNRLHESVYEEAKKIAKNT